MLLAIGNKKKLRKHSLAVESDKVELHMKGNGQLGNFSGKFWANSCPCSALWFGSAGDADFSHHATF